MCIALYITAGKFLEECRFYLRHLHNNMILAEFCLKVQNKEKFVSICIPKPTEKSSVDFCKPWNGLSKYSL